MAREEPLLSGRPSSDNSSERQIEEEDALLTGERTSRNNGRRKTGWAFWREIGLFVWALLATTAVIIIAVVYQHERSVANRDRSGGWGKDGKPSGKRNLIFMVSDGMGPTSLSLTRSFRQFESGLPIDDVLVLDQHLIGSSRTRSTSSLITDSAAGATAFSCGFKSYNGAISVRPDHSPCGTVLEAAKKAGYMTGLVVTTRITDATPACFAAHVNRREYEDRIAEQEVGDYPLGRVVDLMLGGGRCHFLPNTTSGSCRADDKDVTKMAQDRFGFGYIDDRAGFDDLQGGDAAKLPLLGLFAGGDIPYEIDRRNMNDVYPSLEEMTRTALKALSDATKDSEKGFFIMIEGSRIDHAGHSNDPAAQVHEVIAYDKAFAAVLEFLDNEPTEGILIATSDHETGGLATARQLYKTYPEYLWYPGVLANASHSAEYLARNLHSYLSKSSSAPAADKMAHVKSKLVEDGLGIYDATESELSELLNPDAWPATYLFADMISRRAQTGWTTHGHSAVDVNIYASSPAHTGPSGRLLGNHENTEVGEFLAEYLDLDLKPITQELNEKEAAIQMGTVTKDGRNEELERLAEITMHRYHGDFRNKKRDLGGCECGETH